MKVVRGEIRALLGAGDADMLRIMASRDDNGCQGIGIITRAVGGIDTVAGARPCTGVTTAKSASLTACTLGTTLAKDARRSDGHLSLCECGDSLQIFGQPVRGFRCVGTGSV